MNINTSLTGGLAVGAAVAVLLTHGGDYSVEEIGALAAGLGTAINYMVKVLERVLGHYLPKPDPLINLQIAEPPS